MSNGKTKAAAGDDGTKKTIKVLQVEDDQFLAGIYSAKLSVEGFAVLHAVDGAAGLKLAREEKPDVILLDILMPKMDGFEVLQRLKKSSETNEIPVIILTNLAQKEDVDRGLKLGAADYLIKAHVGPADTVQRIKKVLKLA
ncbi:response regulator [Patescibacteria group bacterium]|nr:MAG: response regulator [Patescibacteria group bacterium]